MFTKKNHSWRRAYLENRGVEALKLIRNNFSTLKKLLESSSESAKEKGVSVQKGAPDKLLITGFFGARSA